MNREVTVVIVRFDGRTIERRAFAGMVRAMDFANQFYNSELEPDGPQFEVIFNTMVK